MVSNDPILEVKIKELFNCTANIVLVLEFQLME